MGPLRFPFFHAVDYFSTQACTQFHDRVYGLLALTRSQIPIDYRLSRIRLFAFLWTEYLLSWGFLVSGEVGKYGHRVFTWAEIEEMVDDDVVLDPFVLFSPAWFKSAAGLDFRQRGVVPFMALQLSCMDPVVFLVARAVARTLSGGGGGEGSQHSPTASAATTTTTTMVTTFMEQISCNNSYKNDTDGKVAPAEILADVRRRQQDKKKGDRVETRNLKKKEPDKGGKGIAPEMLEVFERDHSVWREQMDRLANRLDVAAANDGLLTFGGVDEDGQEAGETRRYSEWIQIATSAAERIWDRYAEFTIDDSDRLIDDDVEWTLIA